MKDTLNYNFIIKKIRQFFQEEKGYLEVPVQSRLSLLLACEDPRTIATFTFRGEKWPLPQSGQPELEMELLKNPSFPGVYCILTSFRNEPEIIPGRHETVFPLVDFEGRGTFDDLKRIETEFLTYLGFPAPITLNYEELCKKYKTDILTSSHELQMQKDFGNALILEKFPERTHPFWNMKYAGNEIFNKADVILYGMEAIGSAERSCDVDQMRHFFHTVEHGNYANLLFNALGKEKVLKELDEYLALPMVPRFGAGIGIQRVLRAMKLAGLDYQGSIHMHQTHCPAQQIAL